MSFDRWSRSLMFAMLALGIVGCGPSLVPVKGVCKRNGKPVSHLALIFAPSSGQPIGVATDDEGRFDLNLDADRKGIPLGTYTVIVSFQFRTPQEEIDQMAGKFRFHPAKDAIVQKYGAASSAPLVVEITHANQVLELNLD